MQSQNLEKSMNSNQVNSVRTQQRKQVGSNKKNGLEADLPGSAKGAGTARIDLERPSYRNHLEAGNKHPGQVPAR